MNEAQRHILQMLQDRTITADAAQSIDTAPAEADAEPLRVDVADEGVQVQIVSG